MAVPLLHVEDLQQLRSFEEEAAARLNERPNLARLFLIDPVRALEAAGVTLSPRAVEEWRKLAGSLPSIPGDAFALFRESNARTHLTVKIHGILPPAGRSANDEVPR
ncbi:MAG: hypothetical protein EPN47_07420 [Acidobacteria bacterium]|nr:MAG: hypothetical protein EPN47_07420 [Acidobacteriota bacterium]